jgi:hypothetical protein
MQVADRLNKLATFYDREARRCLKAKSYLAACIMQVSALEAALQAMCFLYPADVKRTTVYQRKRFRNKRYRALEFTLFELINIADQASWFPEKKINWGRRTNLAGFTHEIRKLRNFVHPGIWARERNPTKFSKDVYDIILEVFEVATSWLLHRVERSLHDRMKRDGLI